MRRITRLRASGRASVVARPASEVWSSVAAAGPGPHWYVDARPFVVRGALDRLVGGDGRRWPVPDRALLETGDRAGFWEVVEADASARRLVLEAAVRAPGTVRLSTVVLAGRGGCELRQTVTFEPDGALGAAYLLLDLPAREAVIELTHRHTLDQARLLDG